MPTGLSRIEGNLTSLDFSDKNVTIVIVDSGVYSHPDLNLIGTKSCLPSGKVSDDINHGTHVAGIAEQRIIL